MIRNKKEELAVNTGEQKHVKNILINYSTQKNQRNSLK
jgi:hypothetical protein